MRHLLAGLFHRAISLSGSSLNAWAFAKNPKEQSIYLGKSMGCPTNNSIELVKCLKALDSDTIATSFKEARVTSYLKQLVKPYH